MHDDRDQVRPDADLDQLRIEMVKDHAVPDKEEEIGHKVADALDKEVSREAEIPASQSVETTNSAEGLTKHQH